MKNFKISASVIQRSVVLLFSLPIAIVFSFHALKNEVHANNEKQKYCDIEPQNSQLRCASVSVAITNSDKPKETVSKTDKKIKRFFPFNNYQQKLIRKPLVIAPDPGHVQKLNLRVLPRKRGDERQALQVRAKPIGLTGKRLQIGIVVNGLGLSDAATETAIQGLPAVITLAFAPYSKRLIEWIRLARAAGHEVLINLPMERLDYPNYVSGPYALMTTVDPQENIARLLWNLDRGTGYVGVVDYYGSRFTASYAHMNPILQEIKRRGLLYLDSGISQQSTALSISRQLEIPAAQATLTLDGVISRRNIDIKFFELEQHARKNGNAIGIASPYPVSLERIAIWVPRLEARGYTIVPITAIVKIGNQ